MWMKVEGTYAGMIAVVEGCLIKVVKRMEGLIAVAGMSCERLIALGGILKENVVEVEKNLRICLQGWPQIVRGRKLLQGCEKILQARRQ